VLPEVGQATDLKLKTTMTDQEINAAVARIAGVNLQDHKWQETHDSDECAYCGRASWQDYQPCRGPNYLGDESLIIPLLEKHVSGKVDIEYRFGRWTVIINPFPPEGTKMFVEGADRREPRNPKSAFCRAACLALIAAHTP